MLLAFIWCITLDCMMIRYIIMAVFLFPSVRWRPSWISLILGHFPWMDFGGLFFTHYRGINEVISIEKPFPSIFLNLTVYFNLRLPDYMYQLKNSIGLNSLLVKSALISVKMAYTYIFTMFVYKSGAPT